MAKYKQMTCLHLPDGKITNDIIEMCCHAVVVYSSLYKADHCNSICAAQLLHELPQIYSACRTALDTQITFKELTIAVGQLKPGHSAGIDRLTSGFYKHFWQYIGMDLY